MNKKLTTREAVIVLAIFGVLAVFGVIRFRTTRDRYQIYIGNVVAKRVKDALLEYHKNTGSYSLLRDTLITDYDVFRECFPLKLPGVNFQQFTYKASEKEYYISLIANDRGKTEIKRSNR
jgi:type II secretory pathway pseudopilin PulG